MTISFLPEALVIVALGFIQNETVKSSNKRLGDIVAPAGVVQLNPLPIFPSEKS